MPDRYVSFSELAKHETEGRAFVRQVAARRSPLLILAPHGGGIEPGTGELAQAIAGERYSLYVFDSLKKDFGSVLHLTSTRFDDPVCLDLLQVSRTAIALHGCLDIIPCVYVGGLDQALAELLSWALSKAGFQTIDDDSEHAGRSPSNLCNRCASGRGVQLELSKGLRDQMFLGMLRWQRKTVTSIFVDFVTCVRDALQEEKRE